MYRDADADGRGDVFDAGTAADKTACDCNAFGNHARQRQVCTWHEDREFFAADAGADVVCTNALPDRFSNENKNPVALCMTETVVDALEVIHID